jgi:hypothetical protein
LQIVFDKCRSHVLHLQHLFEDKLMTPTPKSAFLTVRVTEKTRAKFCAKAVRYGTPSDVLRELVEAFVDERLEIHPPITRNSKETLYVTRNQD